MTCYGYSAFPLTAGSAKRNQMPWLGRKTINKLIMKTNKRAYSLYSMTREKPLIVLHMFSEHVPSVTIFVRFPPECRHYCMNNAGQTTLSRKADNFQVNKNML